MSLLRGSRPKSARASPHIWLTLFQISSKSVHFQRSYCRMSEERFCPIQYLQYRRYKYVPLYTGTQKQAIGHCQSQRC